MSKFNLLTITPNTYEDLKEKGVLHIIENFNEDNFFNKCIHLFPIGRQTQVIKLAQDSIIMEYGWKTRFNYLNKFKIVKFLGVLPILFNLIFRFPFVIRQEKISVIRSTDPYLNGLIGIFYSRLFNLPLVVSLHADYEKGHLLNGSTVLIFGSRKLARILEQFVYNKADLILPIRDHLRKNIVKDFNVDISKIKIFPHGVNVKEFDEIEAIDIYKKFNIDKDKKIISFAGRFSKENYIDDVIQIANELNKQRDDFIFLLLGKGNEYEAIKKSVANKSYIVLGGFQNKEIVFNVRKQSYTSVVLMGGYSLIEAALAGKPIISYDVEWHYELVVDLQTGFLIKENNIDEAVSKLNILLNDDKLSAKMGNNVRKLALQNHDIKKTTKIKQDIYKGLLN